MESATGAEPKVAPDHGSRPRVSVVIPNYNQSHFLVGALDSVLAQTVAAAEVIVVDDGSTDDCRQVLTRYGDPVRVIHQGNLGLAGARNTGIRAATGEFVALLDADDQWMPTYLATMLALADCNPEAAVYYCQARCMDEAGRDLPQVLGGPPVPPTELYATLVRANFLIPSTILMRRRVVVAAGMFDATLRSCEDWDLWLRLLPQQQAVGTDACLVRYRQHGASLSKDPRGMLDAATAVIRKHFGEDDGKPFQAWSDKRWAYGGLYRYHALVYVQRRADWETAAAYLRRGLRVDRTLADDLSLFYELAMGTQATGFRGTGTGLDLAANAAGLQRMLTALFDGRHAPDLRPCRGRVHGMAWFGLGLLAYNTNELAVSRRALSRALTWRPGVWREPRLRGALLKSLAGDSMLRELRHRGAVLSGAPR